MSTNITLNKPATANNSFAPFLPALAVDEDITYTKRWVTTHLPGWLMVDLKDNFWTNEWRVYFMGIVGWTSIHNVQDFLLEGSLNGTDWFLLQSISGNTSDFLINRFVPRIVRFLRIYITKGHQNNSGIASIVELKAFEPDYAPFLSSLVPNTGSLGQAFYNRNFNYTMNVANEAESIAFTPVTLRADMEIRVNDSVVASGKLSQKINLTVGNNPVQVTVKSNDGTMTTTYTINVRRLGVVVYLSALEIKEYSLDKQVKLNPAFDSSVLSYTATVSNKYSSIKVTPTTKGTDVTIKVNGSVVPSGTSSGPIALNTGSNTILIDVCSAGDTHNIYSVVIVKAV
jgi:hypothetical protein